MDDFSNSAPRRNARSPAGNFSALNAIAGIWLIISPFLIGYTANGAATWNSIIIGAIVLILGWIRAANLLANPGLSWINAILGIWMMIAPLALVGAAAAAVAHATYTNDIIVGIIVLVLGIASAAASSSTWQPTRR